MKSVPRAGALALAGLTTFLGASLTVPDRTGRAELAQAAERTEPALGAERVARLAAARARAASTEFPVVGEFNWGQAGARFGASRSGHLHEGQDVFARTGAPLVAVTDGVVVEHGNDGGRGNYVAIHDPRADRTYVYLHMVGPSLATTGEHVGVGDRVGAVGCTGSCYGDHLHFEIRRGRGTAGASEDPLPTLTRWAAGSSARPTLAPGAH